MVVEALGRGGEQGGSAAADGFQEGLDVQAGPDVQLAPDDTVDSVADKDVLDDGTAVHKEVELGLALLPAVVDFKDPLAECLAGHDVALGRRGDFYALGAEDRYIGHDDLAADRQSAGQGGAGDGGSRFHEDLFEIFSSFICFHGRSFPVAGLRGLLFFCLEPPDPRRLPPPGRGRDLFL